MQLNSLNTSPQAHFLLLHPSSKVSFALPTISLSGFQLSSDISPKMQELIPLSLDQFLQFTNQECWLVSCLDWQLYNIFALRSTPRHENHRFIIEN